VVHKQGPGKKPDGGEINQRAYIPDEPLRLLARMIAGDILTGSRVSNTTPDSLESGSQREDNTSEKKNKLACDE
jgi:hypothetical protein